MQSPFGCRRIWAGSCSAQKRVFLRGVLFKRNLRARNSAKLPFLRGAGAIAGPSDLSMPQRRLSQMKAIADRDDRNLWEVLILW
jgi:hypothetical protein